MSILAHKRKTIKKDFRRGVISLILTIYSLGFLAIQTFYLTKDSDFMLAQNITNNLVKSYQSEGFFYYAVKYSYDKPFDNPASGFGIALGITISLGIITYVLFSNVAYNHDDINKARKRARDKDLEDEFRK